MIIVIKERLIIAMKRKTVIIFVLLIILSPVLFFFIIRTNNGGLPAAESPSAGEVPTTSEIASSGETSPSSETSPSGESTLIITSERRDRPIQNGGDYSDIFYYDDDGNSVDKSVATKAVVKEYKNDGTVTNEIFADIYR